MKMFTGSRVLRVIGCGLGMTTGLLNGQTIADESLLRLSFNELFVMAIEKNDDCYIWLARARNARQDYFPDDDLLPIEVRHDIAKMSLLHNGPDLMPETSAGYQLGKLLYDMSSQRMPDDKTAMAVFRLCMTFDPGYVGLPGGSGNHPNPEPRRRGQHVE